VRLRSKRPIHIVRATPQNHTVKDTFYWPDMPVHKVMQKRDKHYLPTSNQEYNFFIIGGMRSATKGVTMHDRAVYSIWYHFVASFDIGPVDPDLSRSSCEHNIITGTPRLPIFVDLAQREEEYILMSDLFYTRKSDFHSVKVPEFKPVEEAEFKSVKVPDFQPVEVTDFKSATMPKQAVKGLALRDITNFHLPTTTTV
jgi:hypothetical protein